MNWEIEVKAGKSVLLSESTYGFLLAHTSPAPRQFCYVKSFWGKRREATAAVAFRMPVGTQRLWLP